MRALSMADHPPPPPPSQASSGRKQLPSASLVQVCDRCRWTKIKCDGTRPCGNCRRANLPCESRARLSKHSTPRSYVQYLEERVRQLEGEREATWSPQASESRNSPYGSAHLRSTVSHSSTSQQPKKKSLPEWSVLKEFGTHVIDEDGFTRYMGPSSGVGFSAKVLQEILEDEQPADREYYSLFSLDDFSRARALEAADHMLWEVVPTNLPKREDADRVIADFFTFTERVFPLMHRPTFMRVVDQLYSLEHIGPEWFELLAQFYIVLSIGHSFNLKVSFEERTQNQIRGLQTGVRCFFTTLHTRRDGLTRLQTFTLHSYALVMLRQRAEAMRMSSIANTKALECGLHHDGHQYSGNPLETEMRRRVFWCVFMLHLFNSSIEGLPRSLHEADITVAEPSDVDDEQLTTTAILQSTARRTKIHRFVSVCRLVRILSRSLDVLYSHTKRKHASTLIEQMVFSALGSHEEGEEECLASADATQNRLCCEHLLDQLDFTFDETPDDVPHQDTEDPAELAILASYSNELILYHYVRWLIHRPGLALPTANPQFSSSLHVATEAATELLKTTCIYKSTLHFIKANPAVHPCTIFIASLTPLYRTTLLKANPVTIPAPVVGRSTADNDLEACRHGLDALGYESHGHSDVVRRRVLQDLMKTVFDDHYELRQQLTLIPSRDEAEERFGSAPAPALARSHSPHNTSSTTTTTQAGVPLPLPHHPMDYHELQLLHYTAHEDLTNLVHDTFNPVTTGAWVGGQHGAALGGGWGPMASGSGRQGEDDGDEGEEDDDDGGQMDFGYARGF